MSARSRAVDPVRLARWCRQHLGSPPAEELFRSGHLSAVVGLRLADDREVVVKVRPDSPRIAACVEVQRRLFQAGYPCPRPLTGAVPIGADVATAEAYVPGRAPLAGADHAVEAFAEAFPAGPSAGQGVHARPGAVVGGMEPHRGRAVATPGGLACRQPALERGRAAGDA